MKKWFLFKCLKRRDVILRNGHNSGFCVKKSRCLEQLKSCVDWKNQNKSNIEDMLHRNFKYLAEKPYLQSHGCFEFEK